MASRLRRTSTRRRSRKLETTTTPDLQTPHLKAAAPSHDLFHTTEQQQFGLAGCMSSGHYVDYVLIYRLPEDGPETDYALMYLAEQEPTPVGSWPSQAEMM